MKIDIKSIAGYEAMTPEEKLAALEKLELPDPDLSGYVPKDTADKYAAEAAQLKKQLRERMSEEEAAKAKQAEAQAAMEAELAALKKERTIDRTKAKLLELGWSGKLSANAAEALANGEMDKVFDAMGKFIEEHTKQIKGELLRDVPPPPPGGGGQGITPEQFKSMSLSEKAQLAQEQPEVYRQLTNGG